MIPDSDGCNENMKLKDDNFSFPVLSLFETKSRVCLNSTARDLKLENKAEHDYLDLF